MSTGPSPGPESELDRAAGESIKLGQHFAKHRSGRI